VHHHDHQAYVLHLYGGGTHFFCGELDFFFDDDDEPLLLFFLFLAFS
jgi:hypothetical protein